jgi:hypothetical protein
MLTRWFRLKVTRGREPEAVSGLGLSLGLDRRRAPGGGRGQGGAVGGAAQAAVRGGRLDSGAAAPDGLHRTTIRRALRRDEPRRYRRRVGPSKLDPFKPEIRRLLREDPRLPTSPGARADLRAWLWGRQDAGLRVCRRPAAAQAPRPRTFQRTVTAAARCCSSIFGGPAGRCRSGTAGRGAVGWLWRRWGSRVPARAH